MKRTRTGSRSRSACRTLLPLGLAAIFATAANAQSIEFGRILFQQNCAACHGLEGAGDGPVAESIDPAPADLGQLSASNDGTYPFGRVWDSISSGSLAAHGNSEMPIWGDLFMAEALPKEVHPGVSASALVEARMMALTYYIQTLQD